MSAFDAFLEIDGIKGESQDSKHKDKIELQAYSFGVSQPGAGFSTGGGGGAGKATFQDFNFSKRCDKATPLLFAACAQGTHIKKAQLVLRKAGDKQQDYFIVDFTDVLISSQALSGQGSGDPIPTESISFNFTSLKMSYSPQKADGSLDTAVVRGYDVKAQKKIG
jgi:type VI secretion system secreted protein Hcp